MYQRRRIHPLVKVIGVVAAIVLVIFILGRLDFPGWILRGLSGLVPTGPPAAYTAEEVEEVRNQIARFEAENAVLNERIENLQQELGIENIEARVVEELLTAQVIYRDHTRIFEMAILNRGTWDGVEVGMPVIDDRGVVGRVVSASSAICRIELVSSPDCSFGVIDQRSRELGIVRGSHPVKWEREEGTGWDFDSLPPNVLELEYLSPSADISVHDTLVTSGLSGITPSGLRVGEVVEIISRAEQDQYDIRIEPFADLEHLETVAIVLYTTQVDLEEMIGDDLTVGPPAPE